MTANLHMNVYAGKNAVAIEKSKNNDTYFLELSEVHASGQRNTVCAFMTREQLADLRFAIERVMADNPIDPDDTSEEVPDYLKPLIEA